MDPIKLYEVKHPHKAYKARYECLIGLDHQKKLLLSNLQMIFDPLVIQKWQKKYHPKGLNILDTIGRTTPLVLLSGDVGCGKTELASCIGTPLSEVLGEAVRVFETPSDIRGGGLVGQLSARVTASFGYAASQLKPKEKGILIIDEADDLATDREQAQAHHEDRAGVNALIKEIDRIEKESLPLAILLITNRSGVIDPAILRRAMVNVPFNRPDHIQVQEVLEYLLADVKYDWQVIKELADYCVAQSPGYSFSDFFVRIARQAVIRALQQDQP